jgi:hypothetical protein
MKGKRKDTDDYIEKLTVRFFICCSVHVCVDSMHVCMQEQCASAQLLESVGNVSDV